MLGNSPPVFNYLVWTQRFPQLATIDPTLAQLLWNEASALLAGGSFSCIRDPAQQTALLNLLTAHLAQLQQQSASGNGMVGRISSATQGSVSVSTDLGGSGSVPAWYAQTQYGLQFWQATAGQRQAHYIPGPERCWPGASYGRFGVPGWPR